MIRRQSMSLLHAIMDDDDNEQNLDQPLWNSRRRSKDVDHSADTGNNEEEETMSDENPPDLPTTPRPSEMDKESERYEEHVEVPWQKRSFNWKVDSMLYPDGLHISDNRIVTSLTSRSSSTVQTPFTAVEYNFSFWDSNSPGISLHSPARSTFFSDTPSDTDHGDTPRSWSSRVVAHEEFISVEAVPSTMSGTDHHYRSISDDGSAGDGYNKPQGLMFSQSASALDKMDDDLLIRGGDLGRTKRKAGINKPPMCGLPSGDAKNEIQYKSLEDIVTALSPIQHKLDCSIGEEKWKERKKNSEGELETCILEERRRSKAEITPSHSPSHDDDCGLENREDQLQTQLRLQSNLQQSLERIEGNVNNTAKSYLGVQLDPEEEEFHECEEQCDEEVVFRILSTQKLVTAEDYDEDHKHRRTLTRHNGKINEGNESLGEEVHGCDSIDEPSDLAPCLSPTFEGDVSTCVSISCARTPGRETATNSTSMDSCELISSSMTATFDPLRRCDAAWHTTDDLLSFVERTVSTSSSSPSEPEEQAPGTCADFAIQRTPFEESMPSGLALHRRAISNSETRQEDMQNGRRESEIIRTRSSGGRSSMMAGRCLSQVMPSLPSSPSLFDSPVNIGRNLSNSDPALNELEQKDIHTMQQKEVAESRYDGNESRQPPPVLLPRKQSNLNSWRSSFAVATARGVMNPRVQLPQGRTVDGIRTTTPPSREPRERHGTLPADMFEREVDAEKISTPLSGSPSSVHHDRVLIRSSSHSAVGGFMRRSLRFLRGESGTTPLTPMTSTDPSVYTSSLSFSSGSISAPGAPMLSSKDSASASNDYVPRPKTLRHTLSFGSDFFPPLLSPSSLIEDIEEETNTSGHLKTPIRRIPHRRTMGAFHGRPSPAKDRLKLRPGERSRVDKKKESGGSTRVKMLDSLSNAFFSERKSKKSKTSDRSLDGFMQQFGMRGNGQPRRAIGSDGVFLGCSSVDGLPDEIASVLADDSPHGGSRLPSMERSPSAIRSPNRADDYSFEMRSLNLCSDLWDRFGLFDQEIHSAWHEKYSTDGLSSKQLKKQDAIFELIGQERRHCAHLAFLKKGYRQRLVEEHVLSAGDADRLIPDVLDAMLAFHLHLLDRLVERQRVAARVNTVADIIAEELGDTGRFTTRAVDAYISFGAAKESAEAYYSQLLGKGGRFAGFYNKLQTDPNYRRYAYKTLLTVIIGRPTKYLLMLDQILKNEENEAISEQTKEAAETARKFASRIDYGLQVCQMSKKWEEIKGQLEQGSKTMLHTGDAAVPFTYISSFSTTFS
ncbi:hypothetical protein PMAYCL1PPCAC_26658 [Pristionchus mayeri]|uniref:DH domain-containing protein n=1 Tax=Pristionchus mayeri TaxID=1317129 RepID=A0AAN5D4H3_9BILA|nr:hypothetical protein PMAYCL1PPCAC_26658 [Pristionchus mayeri]